MKEVFSRKKGTSMKYKNKFIKIYNIDLSRGVSSIQTLSATVSSFLVLERYYEETSTESVVRES